jgi:hypothetical protein
MKARPKILLALTGVAALSLTYPASVQAVPTTYQYTGNPFTDVSGPYTTSDFVTAMVTLAGPLPPNFIGTVTPTAFTLSDGVQTISNHNATHAGVDFATDATGAIAAWSVQVLVIGHTGIFTNSGPPFIDATGDSGGNIFGFGFNIDTPGEWRIHGTVPDAGSTLSLMTLTLMALGLVARQFKRAAG